MGTIFWVVLAILAFSPFVSSVFLEHHTLNGDESSRQHCFHYYQVQLADIPLSCLVYDINSTSKALTFPYQEYHSCVAFVVDNATLLLNNGSSVKTVELFSIWMNENNLLFQHFVANDCYFSFNRNPPRAESSTPFLLGSSAFATLTVASCIGCCVRSNKKKRFSSSEVSEEVTVEIPTERESRGRADSNGHTEFTALTTAEMRPGLTREGPYVGIVRAIVSRYGPSVVRELDFRGFGLVHYAASQGHTEVLLDLQRQGLLDLNMPDAEGNTPIHWLARTGRFDALSLCTQTDSPYALPFRIDVPNRSGETPLFQACMYGMPGEIVQLLLSYGGSPNARDHRGLTPLHGSCLAGRLEIMEFLISRGTCLAHGLLPADIDGVTPLIVSIKLGHDNLFEAILRELECQPGGLAAARVQYCHKRGIPLYFDADQDDENSIKSTLLPKLTAPSTSSSQPPSPTLTHTTPPPKISSSPPPVSTSEVQLLPNVSLTEAGASQDESPQDIGKEEKADEGQKKEEGTEEQSDESNESDNSSDDDEGGNLLETAPANQLQLAIHPTVPALDWRDAHGWAALHYAAAAGFYQITQRLIKSGATVSLPTTHEGLTALHLAAREGHTALVAWLITDGGISAAVQDYEGLTPADYAKSRKRKETEEVLGSAVELAPRTKPEPQPQRKRRSQMAVAQ